MQIHAVAEPIEMPTESKLRRSSLE